MDIIVRVDAENEWIDGGPDVFVLKLSETFMNNWLGRTLDAIRVAQDSLDNVFLSISVQVPYGKWGSIHHLDERLMDDLYESEWLATGDILGMVEEENMSCDWADVDKETIRICGYTRGGELYTSRSIDITKMMLAYGSKDVIWTPEIIE